MPNLVPIGRALISVSDKTGVLEFAQGLAAQPEPQQGERGQQQQQGGIKQAGHALSNRR